MLDGGARAWEAAGGEVTAEATLPEATQFTANFRSELLATTADVQKAIADSGYAAAFTGMAQVAND